MKNKLRGLVRGSFLLTLGLVFLTNFSGVQTIKAAEDVTTDISSAPAALTEPTESQKQIAINKPGTVFITTYVTGEMVVQSSANYPALTGKGYPFEIGATGSGFVITPDGYILTNGHVVKFTEDQLYYEAARAAMMPLIKDVMYNELVMTYGYIPSDQELEQLLPLLLNEIGGEANFINEMVGGFRSGEVKLMNVKTDIYVQTGVFLSGMKIPIEQGMKAEVKKVDFEGITQEGEVRGKDIALIKVPGQNMPTVKLGDSSTMQVGQRINVIGYPGAATFAEFLDNQSTMEPTVTSGVISAKKKMKDGTEVLQTDASVTYGNSGGPAFSEIDGSAIGIASMVAINQQGFQESGFNYLRPINVAKEFVSETGVINKSSETDKHYQKGLELFWSKHYTQAIKEFQTAKNLYPGLVEADSYITASETAKSQGLEAGNWGSAVIWTIVLGGLGFLFVIIIIVIIVILVKKKGGQDNSQSAQAGSGDTEGTGGATGAGEAGPMAGADKKNKKNNKSK